MDTFPLQPTDADNSAAYYEQYKLTAVGCLVDFLRVNGHTPIEALIDYVTEKRDMLLTSRGEKFTKSAFGIVDYALTWYSKIFLLDRNLCYYINEEEAANHENEFKTKRERNLKCKRLYRKRVKEEEARRLQKIASMKRIMQTIEADLRSQSQEYSPITKAYLVLTSGNKEAIEDIKQCVRKVYIDLIRPKDL